MAKKKECKCGKVAVAKVSSFENGKEVREDFCDYCLAEYLGESNRDLIKEVVKQ